MVAFINALLIGILFLLMSLANMWLNKRLEFWFLAAGFLITLIISYLLIYFSLDQFIFSRLKQIYQSMGKRAEFKKVKSKKTKSEEVMKMVNQTVLEWRSEQQKKIDKLQKTAAYRREFLGNVSHELKTPIFNIQGYLSTLIDGGIYDDNINLKFLKKSEKSVNRMIAIVEDLEEISKFESGELQLHETSFDLLELCREVTDFLEEKAIQNNSRILIESDRFRKLTVKADKKRIRQVLINLIDNAIKYGNPSEGRIKIRFYDFHDHVLVEINDNGMGIPADRLPRIFERFYRIDSSRSREKGGTGLGLAIVKHIIEAHRQSISVRSQPNKGTTFSFTLKRA
jgi:two-component system phosphate regulon sensor histidine kinase PhoR